MAAFFRLVALLFLALFALLATPALADETFLINIVSPLPEYSPYRRARLELNVSDKIITGRLLPLEGDSTPPVAVKGTRDKDDSMRLSFLFESRPVDVTFTRSIGQEMVTWKRLTRSPAEELYFFRYLSGQFTQTALALAQTSCGPLHGELTFAFAENATAAAIRDFVRSQPEFAKLSIDYVVLRPPTKKKPNPDTTYKTALMEPALVDIFSRRHKDYHPVISVPVGSEAHIAVTFRRSGLFRLVNLPRVACGGSEVSYMVVNRSLLFDNGVFSNLKFQQYVDDRLNQFANQARGERKWQFRFAEATLTPSPVRPYLPTYRVRAYLASEVSRGEAGQWDSFYANFRPAELETITDAELSIALTIERLKSGRRSPGNSEPPEDAWFTKERTFQDEAQVTTRIARFVSELDKGWCVFDTDSFDWQGVLKTRCHNKHAMTNGGFRDPTDYPREPR